MKNEYICKTQYNIIKISQTDFWFQLSLEKGEFSMISLNTPKVCHAGVHYH